MVAWHPFKRFLRKIGRGLLWVWRLPNVKLISFMFFVAVFVIVPKEYFARRDVLLFFAVVLPFFGYTIYLATSTADETEEWLAGQQRFTAHSPEDYGEDDEDE